MRNTEKVETSRDLSCKQKKLVKTQRAVSLK